MHSEAAGLKNMNSIPGLSSHLYLLESGEEELCNTWVCWVCCNRISMSVRTKCDEYLHIPHVLHTYFSNETKLQHSPESGTCLFHVYSCIWKDFWNVEMSLGFSHCLEKCFPGEAIAIVHQLIAQLLKTQKLGGPSNLVLSDWLKETLHCLGTPWQKWNILGRLKSILPFGF